VVQVVSTGDTLEVVRPVVQVVSTGDTTLGVVMPEVEVQLVVVPVMASTALVEVPPAVPVGPPPPPPPPVVELKVGNGGGEAVGRVPLGDDRGCPVSETGMLMTGVGVLTIGPGVLMMDSDELESPPLGGDAVDPGLPPVPHPLDGPVVPQGTVEFWRGKGGEMGVTAGWDVEPPVSGVLAVTSIGPVPVGPALSAVELGKGNGAELNREEDGPVPRMVVEVKPPVPPLPVGAMLLKFDSGYGALLLGIPGAVPVPRGVEVPTQDVGPPVTVWFVRGYGAELGGEPGPDVTPVPELRGDDDPVPATDDALVALGNGNGGELEPVRRLVGAVTSPVVEKAPLLELVKEKGGELSVPEGSCPLRLVPPVGPAAELELLKGNGGRLVLDSTDEPVPVPSPALPVGPAAAEELLMGNGGDWIGVTELPAVPVPNVTVPIVPVPLAIVDELERGNGVELDPVAEIGMPDVGKPVPVPGPVAGPVPVGPTDAVEELLSGKGTLTVLLGESAGAVPVGPEKVPDGPVPQDGDGPVGPAPQVELEAGNGAVEGVVEGGGAPVKDVAPVPGALPDGPDIPVELPAEKGALVVGIVPGTPPVPVPVTDTVPLVTGKGVDEEPTGGPVQDSVPDGVGVLDSDPDVSDRPEETDPVPDVEPTVPGAVPELNPGAVVLPAGKGVDRDEAGLLDGGPVSPDDGPVSPGADVVKEVPVSDVSKTGAVVGRSSVELLCLVTVML
jgi:hypothetical protein